MENQESNLGVTPAHLCDDLESLPEANEELLFHLSAWGSCRNFCCSFLGADEEVELLEFALGKKGIY